MTAGLLSSVTSKTTVVPVTCGVTSNCAAGKSTSVSSGGDSIRRTGGVTAGKLANCCNSRSCHSESTSMATKATVTTARKVKRADIHKRVSETRDAFALPSHGSVETSSAESQLFDLRLCPLPCKDAIEQQTGMVRIMFDDIECVSRKHQRRSSIR